MTLLRDLVVRKPIGAVGGAIVLLLLAVAVFADRVAPYHFNETSLLDALKPPSRTHWFGTDELGRDVYSRVVYGAQISMMVGVVATTLSVLVGATLGVISGYFGRTVDLVLQRLVDAWLAFPGLVMVIVLLVLMGLSLIHI